MEDFINNNNGTFVLLVFLSPLVAVGIGMLTEALFTFNSLPKDTFTKTK